jgi:adenylosuccinate synthase
MSPNVPPAILAAETAELLPYIRDTSLVMREALCAGERILIEGTQGFGLSPVHGDAWPKCTSRDTTAAAFLSEAGISPLLVDEIVLVIRCHPIRVAGDSGPLKGETSWAQISDEAGLEIAPELTSVTQKIRRVGVFDPSIVRRAIIANSPTKIVLNHLDYVDPLSRGAFHLTRKARDFVRSVEHEIGQLVDEVGTSETALLPLVGALSPDA